MQGQLQQAVPLEAEASAAALLAAGILPDLPAEPERPESIHPGAAEIPEASPEPDQFQAQPAPMHTETTTQQLPPLNSSGEQPAPGAAADAQPEEVKDAYRVANIFEHMIDLVGIKLSKRISNDSTEKLYGKHPEKGWNWALGYEKSPQSAVTLNKANRTIAIIVLALIGFTIYGIVWAYCVKPQIENAQAEGTNSIYIPGSYAIPNGAASMPITGQYAPTTMPGTSQYGQPIPHQQMAPPLSQSLAQPGHPLAQPMSQAHSMPLGANYGQSAPYGQSHQIHAGHYQPISPATTAGHYGTPAPSYSQNPIGYPSATQPAYPQQHQTYSQANPSYQPGLNPVYPNNSAYSQYMPPPPAYQPSPEQAYGQPHSVYPAQQGYAPPAIPAYPGHFGLPPNEDRNRVRVFTGR